MKAVNNTWFSIVLAMWIVLLLSLIWLYLMEYMIPFSRNVKGIENASQAYYESYAGVEENLFNVYDGNMWENHSKLFWAVQDYQYTFLWNGTVIPTPWQGNSQDTNYSRISQSEPISLEIWGSSFGTAGSYIRLQLKVPNGGFFDTPLNDDIILVQLASENGSLSSAPWELIQESDVDDTEFNLLLEDGVTLAGDPRTFREYYNDLGCSGTSARCVMKISVIGPLISNSWDAIIPYLEYRIESSDSIPLPNPLMTSQGKSFWFTKNLEVFIPQRFTSSAFDFTVLQ